MASSNIIVELSTLIHENTLKVNEHLTSNGLPTPSFDITQPARLTLPPHIQSLQEAIVDASDELRALMLGPIGYISHQPHNAWTSLQAIQRFKIAHSFPPTETSTFSAVARACSLTESDTRRILRHAMTYYIFREPSPGIVAHTAISKALVDLPPFESFVGFVGDEVCPAGTRMVDAMVKWPGSEEPNHTGFQLAEGTDLRLFDIIVKDPKRRQQAAECFAFAHSGSEYSIRHLLENFEWGVAAEGLLVDVGGGAGTAAIEIARYLSKIKCVVQDLPEVVAGAVVPEDLQLGERLRFMAHDFFQDQPLRGADIYHLRWILHDWSDKYALKILQRLIPALKSGAKILVSDICLSPPCVLTPYQERSARTQDMVMKQVQNAKERDAEEWATLFKQADPRFKLEDIKKPAGSLNAIICAVWTGENTG
ncbi:hypothetical protein G7Y89_g4822 [Cudoniella acicularis]|uniref:O-methyltransferase C-terminal domain-containing protein n=1 Tax=Cudoniella acicularis TaxID=354080 RepID=A0A8H4RQ53_9HELO|nr:hypothetical protein G7Y89_g4822 [Cudoniella acicularis]